MRIVLADDNRMVCEGLHSMLERQADMDVVGEAADGLELVRLVRSLNPDIAITEVAMRGLNGIEATRQIKSDGTTTGVVALTTQTQRSVVAQMIRAGAAAVVAKHSTVEELFHAIGVVAEGKAFLSTDITASLLDYYVRNAPVREQSAFETLTPREREVLQLVTEGESTKKIAIRLNLSAKTIEFHRHRIMKKLDLHNIAGLTRYALRAGITTLEA